MTRVISCDNTTSPPIFSANLGVTVYAEGGGIRCTNTHRCCAERRLISLLEHEAKMEGHKGTKKAQWITKHTGGFIKVWRYTKDGKHACVFPCSICRKSIIHYKLKVICSMGPDEWFNGYLTEENKNNSKLTSGQLHYFSGTSKFPINTKFHS